MHPLSLPILLQGDFERLSSGAPVCHVVTIEHFGGVEEMEKAVFGAPPHSSKYTQQIIKAACHSPSLFPAVAAGNSRFPGWLCSSEPICAHRADVHPNGHVNTRSGAMAGVLLTQFGSDSNRYACLETHVGCARPCESFGPFLETEYIFWYVLV